MHLKTSESDVYRRQILTYKDCPRTESIKFSHNSFITNIYSEHLHVISEKEIIHALMRVVATNATDIQY